MATVLLAAAGAAFGAGFGGTILGLSGAVIGRAIGATVGRVIDQRVMGLGSEPVEVGRLDRFHVMGASEGASVAKSWGRMRLSGQVIWAGPFKESRQKSGSGKGAPGPRTVQFSYAVSLAVALCEGEILGIGRIWADGSEIDPSTLDLRLYTGSETQLPDPAIEAVIGAGEAPSYRGMAYVVIENMALAPFGNRVPQLSFEVIRRAQGDAAAEVTDLQEVIRAVSLIPGTGEYALAPERASVRGKLFSRTTINENTRSGKSDFATSMAQLRTELPNCRAVSMVISWFGDDLRCGNCQIMPKVEQSELDSLDMPWRSGGVDRMTAAVVPKVDGRPIYGGTPSDASVIAAIKDTRASGQSVMFYPFILMEQLPGNQLVDPYTGDPGQPTLPWRGRITLAHAPGVAGSSDLTAGAQAEVAAFFGTAAASDFSVSGNAIYYSGPSTWGYRRFILHYATLCALAGGVEAFCIGSELRGLTQIRGDLQSFPTVTALKQLAADVRGILGPNTKISYAADWSEYFGYHGDGNVYFHLDPLWSDRNIDFIGIDNYMPISDWRSHPGHADAGWRSIYNLDYLASNIAGGEGFDWYYDGPERLEAQLRLPIEDGAYSEPWVFRYKDLQSWWSLPHHERRDGVRAANPTDWVPGSKPIWFTEYGCAAVDNGTNEPNKFVDAKSSESSLPRFSDGTRDDYIQMQYYRAMRLHWTNPANNPEADLYSGRMLDLDHCFAWSWDTRPYPDFPRNETLWADGGNYRIGHWLNGRAASAPLDRVVREICAEAGLTGVDTSVLHGLVKGYSVSDVSSARAALQPLSLVHGFDAVERGGTLHFVTRGLAETQVLDDQAVALGSDLERSSELTRLAQAEIVGRSRLVYLSADGDFTVKVAEACFPDDTAMTVAQSEYSMALTSGQAKSVTERWLAEARAARDVLKVRVPPSATELVAGSVLNFEGVSYRVDRVEVDEARTIEAVRVEGTIYDLREVLADTTDWKAFVAPGVVTPVWMDLPLLRGTESPHSPHLAVTAQPWPGTVAAWAGEEDAGYQLAGTVDASAVIGLTQSVMVAARPGIIDRGAPLRVQVTSGELSSSSRDGLLNGLNTMVIGDRSTDNWEVFQFQEAELVGPDIYDLSVRLRGQAGTDGVMPAEWPVGSTVVLLDPSVVQIDVPAALRGVSRHYRVGAAAKGLDDRDVSHAVLSFRGNGLRPYPVAHLRSEVSTAGDLVLTWVRRTRIDGDGWESYDVPLGEGQERYMVTVQAAGGAVKRTAITTSANFLYTPTMKAFDGITSPFSIFVSQLSESYGAGPARSILIAG